MKTLSVNAATKAAIKLGEQPLIVVKIEWASSTGYYGQKDFSLPPLNVDGRVLNIGELKAVRKQDQIGNYSTIQLTLSDHDLALKAIIDTSTVEGRIVSIFQHFDGNAFADQTLIFKGKIAGPIEWSESQLELSFSVESKIKDKEVGFSVNASDNINRLSTDAYDQAWPLCLGNPIHVRALRLQRPQETTLTSRLRKADNSFTVQDGSTFPQAVTISVSVDGIIFQGQMNGDVFDIAGFGGKNLPKYQSLQFAPRVVSDPDYISPQVAWLVDAIPLVNHFIYVKDEFGSSIYLRVIKQKGTKIWFQSPLSKSSGAIWGIAPPFYIYEVAKLGRDGWVLSFASSAGYKYSTVSVFNTAVHASANNAVVGLASVSWDMAPGVQVKLWDVYGVISGREETYVANLLPSTQVRGVYAYRTFISTGRRVLTAVPTTYYTKNLSDAIAGKTPTTLTFATPLSEYDGQGWEDDIYVTLRSSVGQNTADQIKWLLDNYSNLAVDAASFAAVAIKIANYPSNFARFQKENVIDLVESIAWQARCGLVIENGTVFIKYLSEEPASDYSVDETKIKSESLSLTYTSTEDLITKLIGDFLLDYSEEKSSKKKYEFNNVGELEIAKRNFDFFIYNIENLVRKSVTFWGNRLGRSWRKVMLTLLIREALRIELNDCVTLVVPTILGTIKAIVEEHGYNISEDVWSLDLWLPSFAGTTSVSNVAWVSDVGDVLPADPADKFSETDVDTQEADTISRAYQTRTVTPLPAIVKNINKDPQFVVDLGNGNTVFTTYIVDVYGNGLTVPPTALGRVAYLVDLNKVPFNGAECTFYSNGIDNFIITDGGGVLAKITAVP